ncbi:MAG: hypothetical protein MZV70_54865 [Desulfobacterales bacterium]|nr:hypothetical protein [Desulfobacterales bacterium]
MSAIKERLDAIIGGSELAPDHDSSGVRILPVSGHYAAEKIIIRLHGGITNAKYSSESVGRFGENNKTHRRGV